MTLVACTHRSRKAYMGYRWVSEFTLPRISHLNRLIASEAHAGGDQLKIQPTICSLDCLQSLLPLDAIYIKS